MFHYAKILHKSNTQARTAHPKCIFKVIEDKMDHLKYVVLIA